MAPYLDDGSGHLVLCACQNYWNSTLKRKNCM
jgi:hypothetical protein